MSTGIQKAVDAAGNKSRLALRMSEAGYTITRQTVQNWARAGRIPAERVLAVEHVTGVPRYELRPDLYPPEEYREAG